MTPPTQPRVFFRGSEHATPGGRLCREAPYFSQPPRYSHPVSTPLTPGPLPWAPTPAPDPWVFLGWSGGHRPLVFNSWGLEGIDTRFFSPEGLVLMCQMWSEQQAQLRQVPRWRERSEGEGQVRARRLGSQPGPSQVATWPWSRPLSDPSPTFLGYQVGPKGVASGESQQQGHHRPARGLETPVPSLQGQKPHHHTHCTHDHTRVISLVVPEVSPLYGSWNGEEGGAGEGGGGDSVASPITPPRLTVVSLPSQV